MTSPAARDVPTRVRAAIAARSGGRCELCGRPAEEIHHRRPRRMGGTLWGDIHSPANLVHLDRPCHHWAETWSALADAAGVRLVHRGDVDPAAVPVWLRTVNGTGWWLIRADAGDGGPHVLTYVDPADYELPETPDLTGLSLAG